MTLSALSMVVNMEPGKGRVNWVFGYYFIPVAYINLLSSLLILHTSLKRQDTSRRHAFRKCCANLPQPCWNAIHLQQASPSFFGLSLSSFISIVKLLLYFTHIFFKSCSHGFILGPPQLCHRVPHGYWSKEIHVAVNVKRKEFPYSFLDWHTIHSREPKNVFSILVGLLSSSYYAVCTEILL